MQTFTCLSERGVAGELNWQAKLLALYPAWNKGVIQFDLDESFHVSRSVQE